MKIKHLAVIFTIIIASFLGMMLRQIRNDAQDTVDISSLNASFKQIVSALSSGKDTQELEELYNCEIYLKTDSNYASEVIEAIQNNKILMDYELGDKLLGKVVFSGDRDLIASLWLVLQNRLIQVGICMLFLGYLALGLIYYFYIRPFKKLQKFAVNVAKGNLEAPLSIYKGNYFGAFTESFDLMREELKTARENEYKANVSKKELVAELSHDMKTPIATIKATCEVMKIKAMKNGNESERKDILEKAGIIEQKSDMIDQLISNMFHATLEELKNLKVEAYEEPSTLIYDMFTELQYYDNIKIKNTMPECLVYLDKLRLKQVIDNVVNNSYKYAGTEIEITFKELPEGLVAEIRDFGDGVSDEELPLITEKYFRGTNGKGKNGAGLGLYLAKYFMDNMKGTLECYNDNGFVVNLFLRKV
jgi:signal transduction histidine kinase